jgi:hypothetical protein
MAETKPAAKPAATSDEPTIEERVAALEVAVGITAEEEQPADAVPGEPLKQHELYGAPSEEEAAAYAKQQEQATAAAEKAA